MGQTGKEGKQEIESLKKGKYVFIDDLTEVYQGNSPVPYFSAEAIAITENDGKLYGDIKSFKISDLILKQSSYIDERQKSIEAHQLYIWPKNLGSTKEWTANKHDFLNAFVMNFPIEILSTQESNGVTWKYITPENFKKIPEGISSSEDFQQFAAHPGDYFFLRRPLNEPK